MKKKKMLRQHDLVERCSLCGIGIGRSILYDGKGGEEVHCHLEQSGKCLEIAGRKLYLCGDCVEILERSDHPEKLIDWELWE